MNDTAPETAAPEKAVTLNRILAVVAVVVALYYVLKHLPARE